MKKQTFILVATDDRTLIGMCKSLTAGLPNHQKCVLFCCFLSSHSATQILYINCVKKYHLFGKR